MNVVTDLRKIGCSISGVNLLELSKEDLLEIKRLLYTHKLVILKDQKMTEQQFCDVSGLFGKPVPYLQENYHHPDYPLIFVSSNIEKDGKKIGVARTGGYWHSDTSFLDDPVVLTVLYPQVIPLNSRRTTLFIDLETALSEMPSELRQRLENKIFIHSGKWKYKVRENDVGFDISEILAFIHQAQPPARHPAIIQHPVTGKHVLYASRGFTLGVEGMTTDESCTLLGQVFDFIEQERFISEFQWQLGDILVWDNRVLTHKAGRLAAANDPTLGDVKQEEDTLVYRIIVRDGYPLYAGGAN